YDLNIVARKRTDGGKGSTLTIMPRPDRKSPLVGTFEPFDLDREPLKLTAPEILEFRSGVSIRDIFAARKDNSQDTAPAFPPLPNPATEVARHDATGAVKDMVSDYLDM